MADDFRVTKHCGCFHAIFIFLRYSNRLKTRHSKGTLNGDVL